MFISKVHTRTSNSGVIYYSYKLLSCHIVGGMTKQTTIHQSGGQILIPARALERTHGQI
jgi:hypothetical protein